MKRELNAYLLFSVEDTHDILETTLWILVVNTHGSYHGHSLLPRDIATVFNMRNAICSIVFSKRKKRNASVGE
jgi:hypothetical protein